MEQKTLSIIILSILITAIIVGGAVYFIQSSRFEAERQQLQQQIQSLENQINQLLNKDDNDIVDDPTADWQTYDNYIFEIKYPSDFQVLTEETIVRFNGPKTCPDAVEGYCFDDTLYIKYIYNQGGLKAEDWFIEEADQGGGYTKIGIKEIGKQTAIAAIPKDTEGFETRYILDGGQLLPNNTGQYIIDIHVSSGLSDLLKEQILSTFKFID